MAADNVIFAPLFPWDVHNCHFTNYIMSQSSVFAKVESSLINTFMFLSNLVPWDFVQLLHGHVMLYQDASDSGDAY